MTGPAVVMPVWNGARYLPEAIASLRAQTLQPSEVVVVDDGSTDGSGDLAATLLPEARVVRQENGGVAAALFRGVRETTADIVAFLESDDVWLPEKLAREAAVFAAEPDVFWTLCHADVFLQPGCVLPVWLRPGSLDGPTMVAFMSALSVRREAFVRAGEFDPSYPYAQDTEWMTRAQAAGLQRVILPEVLVRRRVHDANLSGRSDHPATMLRVLRAAARRHEGRS